jgi:hemerythrin-like domain-containing protein
MDEPVMNFANRVNQTLHDEHSATTALVQRLEQVIARYRRSLPAADDPAVAQVLKDLSSGAQAEVERHFAFEEQRLFPYLDAMGDRAIGAHLTEEHVALLPLWVRLAALARELTAQGLDEAGWSEFRRLGDELCAPMLAHVAKEEMALLPLLEEGMDAETEAGLYREYAETA